MIPLSDDNPRHEGEYAWFTWGFIGACIAVFFWQISLPPESARVVAFMYGAVPGYITGDAVAVPASLLEQAGLDYVPEPAISPLLTLLTSMFMHGGFMHLIGNMLYLWIFGDNVEVAMGHKRFFLFYILCGLVAAVSHIATDPSSPIPMVGASGAISGVLGAYLLLYPKANVKVLFTFGFFWRMVHIPAWVVLGLWFGMQVLSGFATLGMEGGGVAFWAHIGGFVAGMVLVKPFLKPTEHLLHKPQFSAWQTRRVEPPKWKGPWER